MTICVTGGTGFLGSRVVAELLARGHDVRCAIRSRDRGAALARSISPVLRERIQLIPATLERRRSCLDLLRGCDVVIHLAAPLRGSPSALFASGVIPTRVLAGAAADLETRRFVLISSLAVYGTQHLAFQAVLDERCPLDSHPHLRDPYTYSKIAQEQVCWEAHHNRGLRLVVLRPGVLFGPGRPLLSARIGLMVGNLMVQMGGWRRVPYCFVDNCAGAVAMAAEAPDIDGMAFNIVDDDLPSANTVLRLHREHVSPIRTIRVPQWAVRSVAYACEKYSDWSSGMFPPVLTQYKAAAMWKPLRVSNALARSTLAWHPHVTFSEAVKRTLGAAGAMRATGEA